MTAAANLSGIPIDVVRRAKKLGCPAFKAGNRIDWQELKEWCDANTDKLQVSGDDLSLKDQKLNEEVRRLRRNNDRDDGLLIPIDKHQAEIRSMAAAVQGLIVNLPRLALDLAGRTVVDIEMRLQLAGDEILGKLSRGEGAA